MLSDDELQALREIERRLRWESPELVQLFNSQEPQPATNHRQRARTRVLLAAAAITGLVAAGTTHAHRGRNPNPAARAPAAHRGVRHHHRPPGRPCFGSRRADRPDRGRRHTPWRRQRLSRHRSVERPDVSPRLEPELTNEYRQPRPGRNWRENDRPLRTGRRVGPWCALAGNQPARRQTIRTRRRLPIRPRANRRSRTGTDDADPDRRSPRQRSTCRSSRCPSPPKTASPATT